MTTTTKPGYRVQVSTKFAPVWRDLRDRSHDFPRTREQARQVARILDSHGGYVRVVDPDGNYVEGRKRPFGAV